MKILQKIIVSLIILSLILPSTAQAGDFIGGPMQFISTLKTTILDKLPSFAKQPVADIIFREVDRLIMGQLNDANSPLAILDWRRHLRGSRNEGAALFIEQFGAAFLTKKLTKDPEKIKAACEDTMLTQCGACAEDDIDCLTKCGNDYSSCIEGASAKADEFNLGMKRIMTSLGYGRMPQDIPSFADYARSTLRDDLGPKYNDFINSGYSLAKGGWDAYFSMMKPQNNPMNMAMMTGLARKKSEEDAVEAAKLKAKATVPFKDDEETIEETVIRVPDEDAENDCFFETLQPCFVECEDHFTGEVLIQCKGTCEDDYGQCITDATKEEPTGIAKEKRVKTTGMEIAEFIKKKTGFDLDKLLLADKIEDLLGMLVTKVLSSVIRGPGYGTTQGPTFAGQMPQPSSWAYKPYKMDMGFLQLQRSTPSRAERARGRTKILDLVTESIGQMSRRVASCKAEEKRKQKGQMPENQEKELTRLENQLLDMLEGFTMQMYTQETGIALNEDFKVLDPPGASKIYGKTWAEIELADYPAECSKFGQLCGDFDSQLPTLDILSSENKLCLSTITTNMQNCKENCGYDKNCIQDCTVEQAAEDAADLCPASDTVLEELEKAPTPGNPGGGGWWL